MIQSKRVQSAQKHIDQLNEAFRQMKERLGIDDLANYGRLKELAMAMELGHHFPENYADADAFDTDGNPVEYKSTIQDRIMATYNGISVQETWEDQKEYLIEEKICKYGDHFFARFPRHSMEIIEMHQMDGSTVYELILPKLRRQFESKQSKKDPRLGATIGKNDIYEHGTQIV